jgi:FAD/FMN-containing dehydrogenase/Fe-S oxidoreductase
MKSTTLEKQPPYRDGHIKPDVNSVALARGLRQKIKGEVRFDEGSRALYSTDGSNYRQIPIGVVVPKDAEDVQETFALCRQYGAPITSRGGGTSLAGQCCNVAVVIDYSKYMNRILEIDPAKRLARVQPGLIQGHLHDAANKYQLTFGPDPATHRWCTIGGMLGNNSCGVHSQMAGRTSDNVHALDILTYDGERMQVGKTDPPALEQIVQAGGRKGEVYGKLKKLVDIYAPLIRARYPRIPRRVSGYNLDCLLPEEGFHVARALVGSEGTCVGILEATLNLVHSPPHRTLVVLGYHDIFAAGDHIPEIVGYGPVGLEALDEKFIRDMHKKHLLLADVALLPPGGGLLLAEFGGDTPEECGTKARKMMAVLKHDPRIPTMKLFTDPAQQEQVWKVRESGLGASAHIPGEEENWEGWEDSAVPPEKVGAYLRDLKKLYDKYDYVGTLYGHFGQGCIHTRINFDLKSEGGIQKWRAFLEEATDLIMKYGGSFSGEHGDGQSRAEFLPKMFGPELVHAFNEFKSIWDPDWKMNPGKVVRPYRVDENLRYGSHYDPPEEKTHFKFPGDGFSFVKAIERCVGVGECRRHEGGTMCPSYMVLHEEEHATRGRARMLFEMLQGEVLHNGWRNDHVKESLDLCLACKGCKGDCPVHVDMATYKAEFLSHYYKRRLRPRHAYAFGLIHRWSRMASLAPKVANYFAQQPFFGSVLKWLAGVAPERNLPRFAVEPFKHWFKNREPLNAGKPSVLLFADTFNNYFHPWVAQAAVEVLEDAGFDVVVPMENLCCGRPLYDYGMLSTAEKHLLKILATLRPPIQKGTPMVVLEPSCCAVFRDELVNLFPHNQDAQRLRKQTFLLSEFLNKFAPDYPNKELHRHALVHVHCHHKAIMGVRDEEAILKRLGLEYELLDSGCCGMAGAFGFEKGDHYDLSIRCGERVLLPKVRAEAESSLIMTNGFSCHEQIAQQTTREAMHLAQVLQMAKRSGFERRSALEKPGLHKVRPPERRPYALTGLFLAGMAAAGAAAVRHHYRVPKSTGKRVTVTGKSLESEQRELPPRKKNTTK